MESRYSLCERSRSSKQRICRYMCSSIVSFLLVTLVRFPAVNGAFCPGGRLGTDFSCSFPKSFSKSTPPTTPCSPRTSLFFFFALPQTSSSSSLAAKSPPASLKDIAEPLMLSGKALARSGEFLIDQTTEWDLYGGALSAVGAQIRNAGDSVAQAAASCRFKTGVELVTDELREAATCLTEGSAKLKLAVDEANADEDELLARTIEPMVIYLSSTGRLLEAAGAALLQRQPLSVLGRNLVAAGNELAILSGLYKTLASSKGQQQTTNLVVQDAAQRCLYASQQMIDAGTRLLPMDERPKTMTSSMGKQW